MRRYIARGWITLVLAGLAVIGLQAPLHAQPVEVPDSVDGGWNVDVAGKLAGSQAAYRNWQEGGLNTLAVTSTVDVRLEHQMEHWVHAYDLRMSFGIIQQDTLAVRKAEDLIRFAGALRYIGNGFFRIFNPTIATGLRTQFAPGFNYDKDPFGEGRDLPVKTADLFSPATLTQSLGLTYTGGWFSERLSAASKETIVLIDRLRPLYEVDPTRAVRYEVGVESVTSIDREVFSNVRVQSALTLFKAVVKPQPIDVIWESRITMRVNSWLNVGFEWVNIYESNQIDAVQVKEVLSVGVSFQII